MVSTLTLYLCGICGNRFDVPAMAESCEANGRPKGRNIKVGDIVTTGQDFGWFDGDKRWVWRTHPDDRPRSEMTMHNFYYVVLAIDEIDLEIARDHQAHVSRFVVATRAMSGGTEGQGYRGGYTHFDYHMDLHKVRKPNDYLKRSSKGLLKEADNLRSVLL